MKNYFTFSSLDYDHQKNVSEFVANSNHPYIENYKTLKINERRIELIKHYAKRLILVYGIYSDSSSILIQRKDNANMFLEDAIVINTQKFLNEIFNDLKRNNIEIASSNQLLFDEEFVNRFVLIRFVNDELILNEKEISSELSDEDISNLRKDIENWAILEISEITLQISDILRSFWNYISTPLYMSDELSQNDFLLFDDDLSPVIPSTKETIA